MENSPVVYRSKVSVTIAGSLVLIWGYIIYDTVSAKQITGSIIFTLIFAFIAYALFFNTLYIINETNLNVKSGYLINKNIDINSITKIIENNGILSAPAASFDRIEVFYNRYDSVVISPRDKKLFAENLKQINQSIVVEL